MIRGQVRRRERQGPGHGFIVGPEDENAILSFRNIPNVQLIEAAELNAYDVLCNDWIVFTKDNLPGSATAETVETAPAAAETTEEAAS